MVDARLCEIVQVLELDTLLVRDVRSGDVVRVPTSRVVAPSSGAAALTAPDLSQIDDEAWGEARRRQDAVKAILATPYRKRSIVEGYAANLGVDAVTLYRWVRAYRDAGTLAALLPRKPSGGRGKKRLNIEVDQIIDAAIEQFYLSKQQRSIRATSDEIARLCRQAGVKAPHPTTVRRRIRAVSESTRLRRRAHRKEADDKHTPKPGHFEEAQRPLAMVQIDHTKLDVMVVDEETRMSIGRPWITLAIDVYSRMIVGYYLSLDPPGANSTGLCLAHAILPKEMWLAARDVTNAWACWGFPAAIHLDNAKEFRGEMLRRACELYDIELRFRPVANPSFGGHVERVLGTIAKVVHELPGSTFSNPKQRGEYDSEAEAAMTLPELDSYIAEYITGVYHLAIHAGIKTTPLQRWTEAIMGTPNSIGIGMIDRPADYERIRLDFMPCLERTIQTYGVRIDGINYYADVLRSYVGLSGDRKRRFVFRRDPADISQVYFWDPEVEQYYTVPYRDLRRPRMSLWELREIRRRLTKEGRDNSDETLIFAAHDRLRLRRDSSVLETKRVRRDRARKKHATVLRRTDPIAVQASQPFAGIDFSKVTPFEVEDVS